MSSPNEWLCPERLKHDDSPTLIQFVYHDSKRAHRELQRKRPTGPPLMLLYLTMHVWVLYSFQDMERVVWNVLLLYGMTLTLPCKGKRQYLLTLQVSRYCILPLQSRTLNPRNASRSGLVQLSNVMLIFPSIDTADILLNILASPLW